MRLIHTLLFLFREDRFSEDKTLATACLKSLEKGAYKTVIVYNQGFLTNEELAAFLSQFDLNCIIIGNGQNVGTSVGRQSCFDYIWSNFPDTEFISEIHLDMIFTDSWEEPLVSYLDNNDEPMISCGIVDKNGDLNFLGIKADAVPSDYNTLNKYLENLKSDNIVHGFTNPLVHVSKILKYIGGYNTHFLTGKQCYEDDSLLLGYYYYYGTRIDWHPKVNYNSVVYHAIAGQRLGLGDNVQLNYYGLVKQYGAMGLKHLTHIHKSQWHINYFNHQFNLL